MNGLTILTNYSDNLVCVYEYAPGLALVVDPPDCYAVLSVLEQQSLNLTTILVTHHHGDHTGGVTALKAQSGGRVIGADARRVPGIDQVIEDQEAFKLGDRTVRAILTPGHTLRGVCYYLLPDERCPTGLIWTGDSLFVGGCGRLFEGSAQDMFDSFARLKALPDETLVYCGHEYTVENYEFALSIEPDNQVIQAALVQARQRIKLGEPTVPSTIGAEKQTNVFMRAQTAGAFGALRERKDRF